MPSTAVPSAGPAVASRIAVIATTTSISNNENPRDRRMVGDPLIDLTGM
nr:hypothetical protein [Ramlibacter sp.]